MLKAGPSISEQEAPDIDGYEAIDTEAQGEKVPGAVQHGDDANNGPVVSRPGIGEQEAPGVDGHVDGHEANSGVAHGEKAPGATAYDLNTHSEKAPGGVDSHDATDNHNARTVKRLLMM